ncbi:MAG: VCBS repeat-containing protein, partial [Oscillospiraceae bacterium]|nr:VCBS repeat-containing protein [Oscillospiraceae bacterium]
EYMAASTIGANILMRSYFAEFLSLKKYNYAVERVLGSFGTHSAAWELHYEDITGIKNKSAVSFDEMCRKYHQFPSYTLIRSPYVWFERAESITYIIKDENGYSMDSYENMYASGNHFVEMDEWLTIDSYENTESFFEDLPEYIKRAYPCPIDFNGDGKMDLICGSADGYIYFYAGENMKTNYEVGAATYLTDTDGNPLNVGAYSSPVVADVNNDGILELFTGSESGSVYCYRCEMGLAFSYLGEIQTGLTDCMIDLGDLNNDGRTDMAVGSRTGEMKIYFGNSGDIYIDGIISFSPPVSVDSQQSWCAPCISDADSNGFNELYVGTFEGYIAKYSPNADGGYYFDGYLDRSEWNYKQNNHLKFGNNCVPRFYDLDGNGMMDLICGQLEYGMAVPIDSEYFPCEEELREQIEYCKENEIYIGAHMMTHEYADTNHEQYELSMQKAAFEKYGLQWEGIGVNQHTWFTSKVGYDANFDNMSGYNGPYLNELNSGLYWNSGSQTPNSIAVPQSSAENSINIPFYLISSVKDGMLMLQPSNIPYGNSAYSYLSAKYEVPILLYDHCDYIYDDESEQEEQIKKVAEFVEEYSYSFVGEDQMAKAVAAAYNTHVDAKWEDGQIKIQAKEASFIKPLLYDKSYQNSVGVKVVFSDSTYVDSFKADANVWDKRGDAFYVSLDRQVSLTIGDLPYSIHIMSVNIPANITKQSNTAEIEFLEGGMMQVKVEGVASTTCEGWETQKSDDVTVFTKYGKAETLEIVQ